MTKWDELVEVAARAYHEEARKLTGAAQWDWLSRATQALKVKAADAALRALLANGIEFVPGEPTEPMWGGLARDIVFAERAHNGNCTGKDLHEFLQNIGRPPPAWVSKEIQPVNHVPPKGTIAACIYKAALSAGSIKPEGE